jgi:hypothetical protein
MASIKSALIFLALVVLFVSINARPFTDGLTSGTILSPFGGALGAGFGPNFNNYAAYNPYAGAGFYGR